MCILQLYIALTISVKAGNTDVGNTVIPAKNRDTRLTGAGFPKGTKTCTLTRTPSEH